MSFDDILESDSELFVDADAFPGVETVTYISHPSTSKSIPANVMRDVPMRDELGRMVVGLQIFVWNNTTTSVTAVDCGGDRVTIGQDHDGTAKTYRVAQIIQQDAGGWLLRLE